jgi:superfamily II DNA/RNA helicase
LVTMPNSYSVRKCDHVDISKPWAPCRGFACLQSPWHKTIAYLVVYLNGSMDMEERGAVPDAFRKSHRVLVSTDAGGEGLNLQFAHVIINCDISWNPM